VNKRHKYLSKKQLFLAVDLRGYENMLKSTSATSPTCLDELCPLLLDRQIASEGETVSRYQQKYQL
jgi:hypothetical protein